MDLSFDSTMTTPTYIIYRDITAGQPYDPTAPIIFYPAKDSDELFDALRAKYPHLKTHSERMRDAVIEFLLEERMSETGDLPSLPDVDLDSTLWQEWPSVSPTNLSTPETASIATPAFTNSPYQASRQHESSSNATSPAELDQMTSVFSLTTADQPRQRVRRKMTDAEKVEYRKRRIMKACEKCSKRKRKCTHNGDESTTGFNTDRINKISTSNTKKSATQKSEIMKDADIFASLDPQLAGEFGDFTLLPQQTNKDVEFNDLFALQNDVGFDMANWYDGTDYAALNYNRVPSLQHSSTSGSSASSTPCVPGDQGSQSPDGCIAPSCLEINPRQTDGIFARGRQSSNYGDTIRSRSAHINSAADQLAFYPAGSDTTDVPTRSRSTTRQSTNSDGYAPSSINASMASHNTIAAASGNAVFEDIAAASTANASANAQNFVASKNARTRSGAVAATGIARHATGDAANVNAEKISEEVAATNNAGMIHEKIAAANINAKTNTENVAACINAKINVGDIAAAGNAGSHQQDATASKSKNIPRNVAAANNSGQEDHQRTRHQASASADFRSKSMLVYGLSTSLKEAQLHIQSAHPASSQSDRTGLSISRQRSSSPSAELFMSRRHIPSKTNTLPADLHNKSANIFQAVHSTDLDGRYGFDQRVFTATPTTPFRRRSSEVSITKISSGQSVAPCQEILKVSYPEAAQSEADTGRKMDHFWVRDHHGRTTTSTSQWLSHICISLLCFAWLCGLFFVAPTPALILSSITYGFVHASAGLRSSGARSLQRIDRLISQRPLHHYITTF